MLLVMSTAGLFGDVMETIAMETKGDLSSIQYTPQYQLWVLSWQRIEKFLPHLKSEIFPLQGLPPAHLLLLRNHLSKLHQCSKMKAVSLSSR